MQLCQKDEKVLVQMVRPDISPSFCWPIIISATLVMFDFCICPLYFRFQHQIGINNDRWILYFIYLLFICQQFSFYSLFIYLIIYLFIFAIYLFGSCVYSLLSFGWFPSPFVFAANNNRYYFIFVFHGRCKMGSEGSKRIDQLVVRYVLGGGQGDK